MLNNFFIDIFLNFSENVRISKSVYNLNYRDSL